MTMVIGEWWWTMEARKSDDDDNRGQSRRFPVEAMRRGQRGDDQRQIRIKEQQALHQLKPLYYSTLSKGWVYKSRINHDLTLFSEE